MSSEFMADQDAPITINKINETEYQYELEDESRLKTNKSSALKQSDNEMRMEPLVCKS